MSISTIVKVDTNKYHNIFIHVILQPKHQQTKFNIKSYTMKKFILIVYDMIPVC